MDEKKINEYFPGVMNPFLIVVEGNDIDVIKQPEVLNTMAQFQRYLAGLPEVGGTLSFADLVKNVTMKYYEDMPKYNIIPATLEEIGQVAYLMQGGGAEPGDFDPFFDLHFKLSNIRIYCRDRVGTTIESVIKKCEEFIAKASQDKDFSKFAKFKLGAGLIALRASIIQDIDEFQLTLLILALASMAFFCTLFFQSFSPTWIFIVPLFISEYLAFSYLAVRGIGLNVDSCPVISIAIGIGDDYGIYLLSRIKEEFATYRDLNKAVSVAIQTTGKAITLIAVTLGLSVTTWAFSSIAFQADMGFLLGLVTCFHLIGTLTFLPALVRLVKPSFIVNQPL